MDAMLAQKNEAGQMILYNRVAGFAVTGNEDGAKNCISDLAAAVELGFAVPPLAFTYWNMGPGPGPDYSGTEHGHEWSATTARTCAHNLHHFARTLRERPIPPEGAQWR
ncbi:Hypothetical Protein RradSPS_0943 [Rubrobacter radiotolerans]|nr:Hypothetical Protein RradSPS_0943 [Rubrobacter radiotolerans]